MRGRCGYATRVLVGRPLAAQRPSNYRLRALNWNTRLMRRTWSAVASGWSFVHSASRQAAFLHNRRARERAHAPLTSPSRPGHTAALCYKWSQHPGLGSKGAVRRCITNICSSYMQWGDVFCDVTASPAPFPPSPGGTRWQNCAPTKRTSMGKVAPAVPFRRSMLDDGSL